MYEAKTGVTVKVLQACDPNRGLQLKNRGTIDLTDERDTEKKKAKTVVDDRPGRISYSDFQ